MSVEPHPDDAERPEPRDQAYEFPPEPPEVVSVKVALVTPSASIEAEDGLIDADKAALTVTVAVFEVAVPPLESVTVTETESVPTVVDVTMHVVLEEVHPELTVRPELKDQE